jgi:RNA polymerase sigma factor (sigma-70 family)
MDDRELLAAYRDRRSPEAFAELVRGNVGMVYAAARRQVDDPHLAEDVTQAVFILLTRKAASVKGSLAGWLIVATRYACRDAKKLARRREMHEGRAAQMRANATESSPPEWMVYAEHLDAALTVLKAQDRDAITLRYLRAMKLQEVADVLGLTQKAAQKRVSRALGRLRSILMTKAAVPAVGVLATELAARGSEVAPAQLVLVVSAVGLESAAKGKFSWDLAQRTAKMMRWIKIKAAASLIAVVGVVGAGTTGIIVMASWNGRASSPPAAGNPLTVAVAATSATPEANVPPIVASDDAVGLYMQAAKVLRDDDAKNIMAPSASDLAYRDYPPMSDEWLQMEKQDYEAHGQVRKMVHQAASLTHAAWPPFDRQRPDPKQFAYLDEIRNLTNEIGDAAAYQSLILKDQPAAFESLGDLMHLAEPGESLARLLLAMGIEQLDANRLMVMISGATITEDASDRRDLPLSTAKDWIARLLDHPDAQVEFDQVMKGEPAGSAANPILKPSLDRTFETIRRVQAERDLAAMSLAAHVYQHEHGRWPENLDELASEMPRMPVDPWGDGKQTLGYVLIKGGLPDGADRPLVYSRDRSKDGLFFRTGRPHYGLYTGDGTDHPKQGGQFRDVARWAPAQGGTPTPTTMPVP